MMYNNAIVAAICFWAGSKAIAVPRQASDVGTGPYPAAYNTDAGLSGQTIFMPTTIPADLKLPVILWGVGGCSDSGSSLSSFHTEIASHGFLVIVNNGPDARTTTNATSLTAAADWVDKVAGTGKYAAVDKTRMAVSGWSCGGLQAYTAGTDARFSTIGIFSSGEFAAADSLATASKITKPIFYFLGGSTDIAYANGERDYSDLPKTTPAWLGNDNKGHTHDYHSLHGGGIGAAAVHWAEWMLRGNASAATFFTDNAEATAAGWSAILSQSLNKINVTAI